MTIVDKSYLHLQEAINEIRKLSHSLVAPSLGQNGLKEAMEELVESVRESNNISVLFFADDNYPTPSVDKNKELMLYRIAQEQLTNIIKYADASEIMRWLSGFKRAPSMTYLVHGEPVALEALRSRIQTERQWPVRIAEFEQRVEL